MKRWGIRAVGTSSCGELRPGVTDAARASHAERDIRLEGVMPTMLTSAGLAATAGLNASPVRSMLCDMQAIGYVRVSQIGKRSRAFRPKRRKPRSAPLRRSKARSCSR